MHLTNANKALIITALLSSIVVLMAYNFHVLKKNEQLAETYFEIIPEEEVEEEQEVLEDILKSLDDVLATNKAYNTTRNYDDFEDDDYKSTIEKIRNRDARVPENTSNERVSNDTKNDSEEFESFENINDIIATRSEEKRGPIGQENGANKNSSVSYSLVNRTDEYLPPPIYLCERGGKIVVNITVDQSGNVIDASYNSASNSNNGCLIDHAIEYAMASKFNSAERAQQIGTITFFFRGKS